VKIADFSPSCSPSLDQQRDALQKGLGRAIQWALAGRLADGPLIDACLHDKRYDRQCEDNRGEWLWTIINALEATERLRQPVLESLRQPLEDGQVTIARTAHTVTYPSRCMLGAAMNPCR
jgi:hypothetical protein